MKDRVCFCTIGELKSRITLELLQMIEELHKCMLKLKLFQNSYFLMTVGEFTARFGGQEKPLD